MAKKALKITKGTTLSESFRWESPKKVYKVITGISNAAPVVLTAVAHGVPATWRGKVTNVVGMTEMNSVDTYHELTKLTVDTLEINAINAVGFKSYTSGGILEYPEPVNLTGYTARMQVRSDITAITTLLELTTLNSGIIIDSTNSTITISISATDTAALTWETGVYSLELISASGVVTLFLEGGVTVIPEVTR